MNIIKSILCHSLLVALGLSASFTLLAQEGHSQHATQGAAPKAVNADGDQVNHGEMDHSKMEHGTADQSQAGAESNTVDHSKMSHAEDIHTAHASPVAAPIDHANMDHSEHASPDEPREPIPLVTDADRAAAFPVLHAHDMSHGSAINSFVLFNRLEAWDADPGTGQAWEAQAWVGGDIKRVWFRSEGERQRGSTESSNLEMFYGRSVSPWWDVVAGVRHDFNPGTSQTWAAIGVQGMAPYKFEVSATAYLGESGQTLANMEFEYEILLTNRLILQPMVELDIYGKDDPSRHIGSGLSKVEAGLRLRYEFTNRRFAPYLGITHERIFGNTADFHRAEGEGTRDTRLVAGIRFWF
jgi:copper resistance protein B